MCFVTSLLERGLRPEGCFHAKRCDCASAPLTARWLSSAALGSVGDPVGCGAQKISSPFDAVLVRGSLNLITGRPSWLVVDSTWRHVMCMAGSNFDMAWTVNSPSLAMEKNEQTRHAKIAASLGSFKSMRRWKRSRTSRVKGALFGRFEEAGARRAAPSSKALYSASEIFHSNPWSTCQALRAVA